MNQNNEKELLTKELSGLEKPEDIQKFVEDAELMGHEDIVKLGNEKLAQLSEKVNEVTENTPSQIASVENLGGSSEELSEKTKEVDEKIESVNKETKEKIEGVEGNKESESFEIKEPESFEEIESFVEKVKEKQKELAEEYHKKVKDVFDSVPEDNFKEFDRAIGMIKNSEKYENLTLDQKKEERRSTIEDITKLRGSWKFDQHEDLTLISMAEKLAGKDSSIVSEIKEIANIYYNFSSKIQKYENALYLKQSIDREPERKDELIKNYKYWPNGNTKSDVSQYEILSLKTSPDGKKYEYEKNGIFYGGDYLQEPPQEINL